MPMGAIHAPSISKENLEENEGSSFISSFSMSVRSDPIDMAVNSEYSKDPSVDPPSCSVSKVRRSLRRKSEVHYEIFDSKSDGESDFEQPKQVPQRWHPEGACRPSVDEAPTFYPSEEEFKDALAYIASIREKAEPYGICRIIPPPSWKPTCPLKEEEIWDRAKFTTRIQRIDKLQNREPVKKKMRNRTQRRKRRRRFRFGMTRRRVGSDAFENDCAGSDNDEKFGFQSGSDFTLRTFKEFAGHFKEMYFRTEYEDSNRTNFVSEESQERWGPTVEEIEGEYWRIVEKSTEEVEVHYGADLETGNFGSGFQKANQELEDKPDPHALSCWNLNNFPRLSGSVLSFESSDISGVVVPWLYVGMCFSSFCWHVEDHHLYSLNYMHFGDPKVWYGVASSNAVRLEEAMKKNLPELFKEQPYLLNELVTQLSPSVLKSEGVPVYRAVQHAGEFVLTFSRAYHAGFNCGFNCAEAVNVAPMDWLPHGQCAVEIYSEQCRKTSLSHDKLLFGAAFEAVKSFWYSLSLAAPPSQILKWKNVCGKNRMLSEAVKERIAMEKKRRESLPIGMDARRVNESFDCNERECNSCFYDLYLSATGCECSPNQFTCLNHTKMLCLCEPSKRFFLFRYDLDELDTLLEALGGEPNAIEKCTTKYVHILNSRNPLSSNDSRPSLVLELKGCSQAPNDTFSNNDCQNLFNEFDSHEKKVLREWENDSVLGIEKLTYKEIVEVNTNGFMGHSLSTKFSAGDIKKDVKIIGKSNGRAIFDLNLDEADLDNGKLTCRQLDTERKEFCGPIDQNDASTIEGEQVEFSNSSNDVSFRFAIAKDEVSKCVKSLTDESMLETNGTGLQIFEKYLPCSSNHSAELAAAQIPLVGNFGEDSSRARSMLFGIDLQVQKQGESFYHGLGIGFPFPGPDHFSSKMDLNQSLDSIQNIELLELGTIVPGKLWYSKEAIFPKGFRSRIKFMSVMDPRETCNYVSEVLPGVLGPLFKVYVEEFPDVVFTGTSPSICWGLVERALEEKLRKYHVEGRCASSFQAFGSMNGMEMFGFLFQPIIQAIEALDPYRRCTEYWATKEERRLAQGDPAAAYVSHCSFEESVGKPRTCNDDHLRDGSSDATAKKIFGATLFEKELANSQPNVYNEVNQVLGGLIGNATPSELDMLQDIFSSLPTNNKRAADFAKLLQEAKKKRRSHEEAGD